VAEVAHVSSIGVVESRRMLSGCGPARHFYNSLFACTAPSRIERDDVPFGVRAGESFRLDEESTFA
jgi:hypothetical protein